MTGRPSVRQIQRAVGRHYGWHPAELRSMSQTTDLCWARHVAVYVSRRMTGLSMAALGRLFGGRDHTTLKNSVERVEAALACDASVKEEIEALTAEIREMPFMPEADALAAGDVLAEIQRHLEEVQELITLHRALLEDAMASQSEDVAA